MNAIDTIAIDHFAPAQPLLPAVARFAIAAAIAAVLAIAWIGAEHESHDAVLVAGTALKSHPLQIMLPKVEVIGRRAA
jgi:hypothetical protein